MTFSLCDGQGKSGRKLTEAPAGGIYGQSCQCGTIEGSEESQNVSEATLLTPSICYLISDMLSRRKRTLFRGPLNLYIESLGE